MYNEQNLVRIAKRENNNKRKYLVVNQKQGKHIPVAPHEALDMFAALAQQLKEKYKNEKLLLIGFAETATAIGAAVAKETGAFYMQTTREIIEGVDYLFFSEEHSHATEQKLVKNDIESIIDDIDRIIFIEDEVTTGNTILNIVNILEKNYPNKVDFSVASLLNGMDESALATYKERNIELFWLVKTDHTSYTQKAEKYKGDGKYIACNVSEPKEIHIKELKSEKYMDARRLVKSDEYVSYCESLYKTIEENTDINKAEKVLVLGTEEYMYPALYASAKIETAGKYVRFHATTRSPISVSTEEDYPLHVRYELKSLYDENRTTFIYDIDKYDIVFIITDAKNKTHTGLNTLLNTLELNGNKNVVILGGL